VAAQVAKITNLGHIGWGFWYKAYFIILANLIWQLPSISKELPKQ